MNIHCYPMVQTVEIEPEKSFSQLAKEAAEQLSKNKKTIPSTQVISSDDLHPNYNDDNNNAFIREMYRLKGFAYLRNQQKFLSMQDGKKDTDEQQLYVVKAASSFQKALGQNDGTVIHKLYKMMRKQHQLKKRKHMKLIDEQTQTTKVRATFINFRRKLEGQLTEEAHLATMSSQDDLHLSDNDQLVGATDEHMETVLERPEAASQLSRQTLRGEKSTKTPS